MFIILECWMPLHSVNLCIVNSWPWEQYRWQNTLNSKVYLVAPSELSTACHGLYQQMECGLIYADLCLEWYYWVSETGYRGSLKSICLNGISICSQLVCLCVSETLHHKDDFSVHWAAMTSFPLLWPPWPNAMLDMPLPNQNGYCRQTASGETTAFSHVSKLVEQSLAYQALLPSIILSS